MLAGGVIGVALCGVFLVPDIWLSSRTLITTQSAGLLRVLHGFDAFRQVFAPTLSQPHGTARGTDLHTQTLVAPLVWLVVVAAVAVGRRRLGWRPAAALAGIGLLSLLVALLITDPSWWYSFPSQLQAVQSRFGSSRISPC